MFHQCSYTLIKHTNFLMQHTAQQLRSYPDTDWLPPHSRGVPTQIQQHCLCFQGYCYDRAVQQGVQHAQLPISDFVTISGRKVLAVNHGRPHTTYLTVMLCVQCLRYCCGSYKPVIGRKHLRKLSLLERLTRKMKLLKLLLVTMKLRQL